MIFRGVFLSDAPQSGGHVSVRVSEWLFGKTLVTVIFPLERIGFRAAGEPMALITDDSAARIVCAASIPALVSLTVQQVTELGQQPSHRCRP